MKGHATLRLEYEPGGGEPQVIDRDIDAPTQVDLVNKAIELGGTAKTGWNRLELRIDTQSAMAGAGVGARGEEARAGAGNAGGAHK